MWLGFLLLSGETVTKWYGWKTTIFTSVNIERSVKSKNWSEY